MPQIARSGVSRRQERVARVGSGALGWSRMDRPPGRRGMQSQSMRGRILRDRAWGWGWAERGGPRARQHGARGGCQEGRVGRRGVGGLPGQAAVVAAAIAQPLASRNAQRAPPGRSTTRPANVPPAALQGHRDG